MSPPGKLSDFTDASIRKYADPFIAQTVDHFSKRYPGKVLGYAIGLQEEHEIKYGQMGYQWRDQQESTQDAFASTTPNSPSSTTTTTRSRCSQSRAPAARPQRIWETRLQEATCAYANVIRSKGAEAIGCFAETCSTTPSTPRVSAKSGFPCIDIAVIDFTSTRCFRAGGRPRCVAHANNHMGSLRYKKVMVAHTVSGGKLTCALTPELIPIIQQAVSSR